MDKKRKDVGGKFCVSGKIFPIYGGVNPIGRNKEAVVNIKSLGVSQQHALFILVDDDLHFISDLKSSNGTFLDNRKLDPLQLYRLENGSRVKFADIEGVYSKLTLTDVERQGNISILSENTQNFTQNFYGSDTQIMDNTTLMDKHDKSSGMKNYIPTQVLAEVADELENSYIQAHEQPTQVVLSGGNIDAKISNKSDLIYHEAETQVMTEQNLSASANTDENSEESHKSIIHLHEAETQVLIDHVCPVDKENKRIDGEPPILVHEAQTQLIVTDPEITKIDSPKNIGNEMSESNRQTSSQENENMNNIEMNNTHDITQDSVNPLGISSNVITDTQNSFYGLDLGKSLDDSESDNIRPVKKSVNIFEIQDSSFGDLRKDSTESDKLSNGLLDEFSSKPEYSSSSKMSLDDSESDIIRPVKKSVNIFESQDSSFDDLRKDSAECGNVSNSLLEEFSSKQEYSSTSKLSLDDSESDIIRPVKKSFNIFESQDSNIEDFMKDSERSDEPTAGPSNNFLSNPGCSSSKMSLDDSECDVIRPVKKSINVFESQDSEQIEEDSNDSVDFMTMQKISNTQKYVGSAEISEKSGNSDHNIHKNDSSEIDLHIKEIKKNSLHVDDGSETEDEYLEEKMKIAVVIDQKTDVALNVTENSHSFQNKPETTNSDTDAENELNSNKEMKRRKNESKKIKKKNAILDSDSETDEEHTNKNKLLATVASNCSDSDTDIENNKYPADGLRDCEMNKENENNNVSVGLILEETMIEDDKNISVKTKSHKEVLVNKDTYSRLSVGYNESLNDSDFIPSTQEDNSKKASQNSRFDNSENSFKLGLTQLMEEDDTSQPNKLNSSPTNSENIKDEIVTENIKPQSGNSQETQKKFVFKKSSLSATKSVDITLDYNEDIYQAQTQNMCGEENSKLNDDHIFLQPTQEAPKKTKHPKEDSIPDDFYLLSTQALDGSSKNNDVDDFYQQSTQKLPEEECLEQGKETVSSDLSENDFYHLPTQKLSKKEKADIVRRESDDTNSEDDDIFATQVMDVKDSPNKYLESALENMFATQRAIPTEDTLDKIQDVVLEKQIIDDKLPTEDKDLEAILCTQKMIDSPKSSKKINDAVVHSGKSLESQLEVLFASQTSNLPIDKFVRPPNPLVNILGNTQDTQELLKDISSQDKEETDEHDESESTIFRQKKTFQIGLEQSFALLEASSTKIRRSDRKKNCEEVSISCTKSRISMTVAPIDKKISEEEFKPIQAKNVRTTRKRQTPTVLESTTSQVKKPEKGKRRRMSETTNSSDEENQSNTALVPHKQTITNKILSRMQEIEEEEKTSVKILERPETPNRIRSSRIRRIKTDENIESTTDEYAKSYRTRTSRVDKTSDPCTSNINIRDKEPEDNAESTLKNNSSKSNEKCTDKVENEGNKERKRKNIEEKKSSRPKTSRVTKITIEDKEPFNESKSEGISRNKTKKVKSNENSCDSFESEENIKKEMDTKNNMTKLKDNIQKQTTPSRLSKRGCSIQVTTPPKMQKVSEATPTRSKRTINVEDTPSRNKRKLKPKVVFTMLESPQLESQIKQLGGSVVDSVDTCTVLITKFVKRTLKLLSAIGLGKPICGEEWVKRSKSENNFLDPWDFVLVDNEAEKKWDFCLKTSLERSLQAKLFEGYTFQLLVTSAQDVLKGAIESCGGKIVSRTPKVANNFVVVAAPEQKDKYKKLLKQQSNLIVVEPEAIFDGVLRQEMRFERHLMK